jgi:small GTP-binding protein
MGQKEALALIDRAAREGWTELDLRDQGLTELPPEIGQLTQLRSLSLRENRLIALSSDVHKLTRLQSIDLRKNRFVDFPLEVCHLTQLRDLDLKFNGLKHLPSQIKDLTQLRNLDLGSNELKGLPLEIGELIQLQSLDLSSNLLTELAHEISRLTKLQSLDLAGNSLTVLPEEIGCLSQMQSLYLGANKLLTLPSEIGKLTELRVLYLRYIGLKELPLEIGQLRRLRSLSLRNNQLTFKSLPMEIGNLTQLRSLDLSSNYLTSLPFDINRLMQLRILKLADNRLMAFPMGIVRLTELESLDLSSNQLEELPAEIGRLSKLQELYLGDNFLAALPAEIGQLTSLVTLSVGPSGTGSSSVYNSDDYQAGRLTELPPEVSELPNLSILDLRHNPLPIPPEILTQIGDPKAILKAYSDYLAGQKRSLNEVKLVLVGEGSVGKTSLANRLLHDAFNPDESKTEGIDIRQLTLSQASSPTMGNPIRVNVWDFGGQEIMHATHQFFLTRRTLYILVLDTRLSEAENRLDYWLSIIRSFGGDSPILVLGNKIDQHPLDLDERGLLAAHPTVQAILETSCKTGEGIRDVRDAIVQQVAALPHVSDPLLNTWFGVKAELEAMDADYIPYQRYLAMCRDEDIHDPDSQRVLLRFLHDLGVVLHFPDPRLETTNILNPEWVTRGVYRILNTRQPFEEQGILTWDMLRRILDDDLYREKRMFIVDVMQKFELCYELPDREHAYLIPDLLPKEAQETGSWDEALAFEVHYSVLPGSVLTRLIVRMHRHVKDQTVWRTGVLLACEGNEALVRSDPSANRIRIRVRGPEAGRRDLLTRIREHLGAIHQSLSGLEADEKVPVPGHPEIPPVDYAWLRECERRGRKEVMFEGIFEPVRVAKLLNGVESPEARNLQVPRNGNVYYIDNSGQIGGIGDDHEVQDGVHFR